jgi:hypothetical protein
MSPRRFLVMFTHLRSRPLRWGRLSHRLATNTRSTSYIATAPPLFQLVSQASSWGIVPMGDLLNRVRTTHTPSQHQCDALLIRLAHYRIDAADNRDHVGQKPPFYQRRESLQCDERR